MIAGPQIETREQTAPRQRVEALIGPR